MPFSSPFNIPLWLKELEGDEDEQFLRDGRLVNGFPLNPTDISYAPGEMLNYKSATDPSVRDKLEAVIKEEMELGGYVVVQNKPTIVSALGAIPKPDSSNVWLIHDCSMPPGRGFNSHSQSNYFKFQTLDDALKMIGLGYFLSKIDLKSAY